MYISINCSLKPSSSDGLEFESSFDYVYEIYYWGWSLAGPWTKQCAASQYMTSQRAVYNSNLSNVPVTGNWMLCIYFSSIPQKKKAASSVNLMLHPQGKVSICSKMQKHTDDHISWHFRDDAFMASTETWFVNAKKLFPETMNKLQLKFKLNQFLKPTFWNYTSTSSLKFGCMGSIRNIWHALNPSSFWTRV